MSETQKSEWDKLTEEQKKEVAKILSKVYVNIIYKMSYDATFKLITPKWLIKLKQFSCFHDWKTLNYSGYSSIVECRNCEKIHTIKHETYGGNK